MNADRWQQIDGLFQVAMELAPERRAAFLDESCSDDEMLRREVESLLAADSDEWDLIENPALEAAAPLLADQRPELAPGQKFGRYEIVDLIGDGGMGEVYLATDNRLNRRIALKLLPSYYTADEDKLRRFQQEARAASALNHPNILTIYELGEVDGEQFIATEFVEGETLRQRMKRTRLSMAEILDVAVQTTSALSMAHKAGIVHRDIKPENIMLRPDGYVKVLDFGLAKLTEQPGQTIESGVGINLDASSGQLMGTVKYMSPEQAKGLAVDARSDIFSIGVLLYEMAAGQAPFKGESAQELINSIVTDEPLRLSEFSPEVPEELQRIISKLLAKDKAKRYQTLEELLADLKTVQGRTTSAVQYTLDQIRQHKTVTALGLLVLVVLIGSVINPLKQYFNRQSPPFQQIEITKLARIVPIGSGASISPDGRYVAYPSTKGNQQSGIWLTEVNTADSKELVPLSDSINMVAVTFSADGKSIYYGFTEQNPYLTLYQLPVLGGTPVKLPTRLSTSSGMLRPSPNGKHFAFVDSDLAEGLTSLKVANADGTSERTIVTRKAPNYFPSNVSPAWSPDSEVIACVGIHPQDGFPRVVAVRLKDGVETPMTSNKWGGISDIAWLPDGRGLLITAREEKTGNNQIWYVSYSKGEARRVTYDADNYDGLRVAQDSGTVIAVRKITNSNLWIADNGDLSSAKKISSSGSDGVGGISWTPDGKIVYTSRATGNSDIWITQADGSNQQQLTTDTHTDTAPAVSRDGRYIIFVSGRTGTEHIWRMDINGGNQQQLTFGSVERDPRWLPDSSAVVYNTWESGKATISKVSVDGGQPREITNKQSFRPFISPDGKLLGYSYTDKQAAAMRVEVIQIADGALMKTFDVRLDSRLFGWTPDSSAITYFTVSDGFFLWSQSVKGGPKRKEKVFDFLISQYAWSPDGKTLIYTRTANQQECVLINELK